MIACLLEVACPRRTPAVSDRRCPVTGPKPCRTEAVGRLIRSGIERRSASHGHPRRGANGRSGRAAAAGSRSWPPARRSTAVCWPQPAAGQRTATARRHNSPTDATRRTGTPLGAASVSPTGQPGPRVLLWVSAAPKEKPGPTDFQVLTRPGLRGSRSGDISIEGVIWLQELGEERGRKRLI